MNNNMKYRTIQEIREAYNNKEYNPKMAYPTESKVREDHVFDENLSVKKNREMAVEHNARVDAQKKAYRDEEARAYAQMRDDILAVLVEEYHFNEKQAEKIYSHAYADKHSFMSDFFYYIEELADLISEIIECK